MIMYLTNSSKDQKTNRLLLVLKLKSGKRWSKRIKCLPRLLGRSQYLLPNYRQISTVQNISNFALSLPLASYLLLAYLKSSTSVTLAFQNWEKQHKLGVKTMSSLKYIQLSKILPLMAKILFCNVNNSGSSENLEGGGISNVVDIIYSPWVR